MNFTTTHIRSEKVTIDTRIYTILNGRKKPGEVYLAAIAPDMELTIITLDEAPGIRRRTAQGKQGHKDRIRLSGCGGADCAGGRRWLLRFRKAEAEKTGRKRSP